MASSFIHGKEHRRNTRHPPLRTAGEHEPFRRRAGRSEGRCRAVTSIGWRLTRPS